MMTEKGMMDGWFGDEHECNGYCGLCSECETASDNLADDGYDAWREEN